MKIKKIKARKPKISTKNTQECQNFGDLVNVIEGKRVGDKKPYRFGEITKTQGGWRRTSLDVLRRLLRNSPGGEDNIQVKDIIVPDTVGPTTLVSYDIRINGGDWMEVTSRIRKGRFSLEEVALDHQCGGLVVGGWWLSKPLKYCRVEDWG